MSTLGYVFNGARPTNIASSYTEFNILETTLLPISAIYCFITKFITYLRSHTPNLDVNTVTKSLEDRQVLLDFINSQRCSLCNIFTFTIPSLTEERRSVCTKNYFLDHFKSHYLRKVTFTKKSESYIIGQNMVFNKELEPLIIMSIPIHKIHKVIKFNNEAITSLLLIQDRIFENTKVLVSKKILDKSNPYSCIASMYKSIFYSGFFDSKAEIILTNLEDYIKKPTLSTRNDFLPSISNLIKQDSFIDKLDEFIAT